jgi:tetratricopeptide (TPR) repeat protein
VKTWETLAGDFPGMPDLQEGQAVAWIHYVALMTDAGRLAERESALRQSLEVMARLFAGHRTVRRYRSLLAHLHLRLAECLDETDHPADALPELERSLELEPGESRHVARVARSLAVCPDREGRGPARAASLAERLLAEKPESGSLWQTLGLARAQAGEWPATIAALERAVSLRGHDVAAGLALAIAYSHRGDKPRARASYDEAIAAIADYESHSHRPRAGGGYLRRLQDQAAALIDPARTPGH